MNVVHVDNGGVILVDITVKNNFGSLQIMRPTTGWSVVRSSIN